MNYYIASLKHTHRHHEHITFWGPEWSGYTPVIGPNIGQYSASEAAQLNDGLDCIAIPVEAVKALQSPTPYYKPGARFYDQQGPVVDNTRKNWNALLAASLDVGRQIDVKSKPEVFRGPRRSFAMEGNAIPHNLCDMTKPIPHHFTNSRLDLGEQRAGVLFHD